MGSYTDTVTPGGSGTLTLINNVDYWPAAKKELLEGLVTSIAKKRMNNPNTWRRLDKITERFNPKGVGSGERNRIMEQRRKAMFSILPREASRHRRRDRFPRRGCTAKARRGADPNVVVRDQW